MHLQLMPLLTVVLMLYDAIATVRITASSLDRSVHSYTGKATYYLQVCSVA